MRTIPKAGPGEVLVQCVWPVSRGPKPDCRADTGVVWAGHGDVKAYPADKWPLLAHHPDVWRLYDPSAIPVAAAAPADDGQATELEVAQGWALQQAMARISQLEALLAAKHMPPQTAAQVVAEDPEERQQQAASRNTDLVAVVLEDGEPDPPSIGVAETAKTLEAHEALQEPALMLTIDDLKAMSVEDVRRLAVARSYMLNPRLKGETLYKAFLEMQALRAEKKA